MTSPVPKRGALIVFEGIDRCGKSTQSIKLLEYFNQTNIPAILIRFPDRDSIIGHLINQYLTNSINVDDQAIHLLFSANRWEARQKIIKALGEGKTVILDRYVHSGAVFSAAKGIDINWCKSPDEGLPAPDLLFYLNLPVEDAMKRGNYGDERYEKEDIQKKVKELFEEEMARYPGLMETLDARQDMDLLQQQIRTTAKYAISVAETMPLGTL